MIYCAIVVKAGDEAGTWIISPSYTRNDGLQAPNILAIAANGITPSVSDVILCAEGINPFDHSSVRSFDDNGGANPIIIATYEETLSLALNLIIQQNLNVNGKTTLGQGTYKMILGDMLAAWAQAKDAEIQALYIWGATGAPPGPTGGINPFPGVPLLAPWSSGNLSNNHKLD